MALLPRSLATRLNPVGRAIRRVNRLCALIILLPYHLLLMVAIYISERLFLNQNELIEQPWPAKFFRAFARILNGFQKDPIKNYYEFDHSRLWGAGPWMYYPFALIYVIFKAYGWAVGSTGESKPGVDGRRWLWIPYMWNGDLFTHMVWSELCGGDYGLVWEPLIEVIIPFLYGRWNGRSYSDLGGDSSLIRLLTLLPGSETDPVRCELNAVNLYYANYEALSYSWGGHLVLRRSITVNGRSFLVTDSVLKALRSLRYETSPRVLWIDQICINQANNFEKEDQVDKMQLIYSTASSVIVWLGAAPKEPPPLRLEESLGLFEGDEDQSPGRRKLLEALSTTVWDLMSRRWWSRVWVVQEVVLAQHVVFRSGNLEVEMTTLRRLLGEMQRRNLGNVPPGAWGLLGFLPFAETHLWSLSADSRRSVQWLVAVADWFRKSQATDPRDKLYGFLGLVNVLVVPDYSLEAHELLGAITLQCIQEHGNLEILGLAQGTVGGSLPTWSVRLYEKDPIMPLWTVSLSLRKQAKPRRPYSASGDTLANDSHADISRGLLRLMGWQADTVLKWSVFPEKQKERLPAFNEWVLLYTLCSPSVRRRDGRHATYTTEETMRLAKQFMGTISADQIDLEHRDTLDAWWEILSTGNKIYRVSNKPGAREKTDSELESLFSSPPWTTIVQACISRAFFITKGGNMGIGPSNIKRGDGVNIFLGSAVPIITRDGYFGRRLVGQAYVDGLMHLGDSSGKDGGFRVEEFELC